MSKEDDLEAIMAELEAAVNEDACTAPEDDDERLSSAPKNPQERRSHARSTKSTKAREKRRGDNYRRGVVVAICVIVTFAGLLAVTGWITTPDIQGRPVSILSPAVKLNNDFKQVVAWNNTIKSAMTTTFNYSFSLSKLSDASSTLSGIEDTIGAAQMPSQFQPVLHAMIEEITYGLDINGYLSDAQKGGAVPHSRMSVAMTDYRSISGEITKYLNSN